MERTTGTGQEHKLGDGHWVVELALLPSAPSVAEI
jgi:hypothetical protein